MKDKDIAVIGALLGATALYVSLSTDQGSDDDFLQGWGGGGGATYSLPAGATEKKASVKEPAPPVIYNIKMDAPKIPAKPSISEVATIEPEGQPEKKKKKTTPPKPKEWDKYDLSDDEGMCTMYDEPKDARWTPVDYTEILRPKDPAPTEPITKKQATVIKTTPDTPDLKVMVNPFRDEPADLGFGAKAMHDFLRETAPERITKGKIPQQPSNPIGNIFGGITSFIGGLFKW